MKTFDILLASIVTCISSLPVILFLLMVQAEPDVASNPPLDRAQVNEIQQLLIDHDPRQLLASDYQEVRLTETELNALLTYLKNNNPALKSINIHVDLADSRANVMLSIPMEIMGFVRYFNLTLGFDQNEDRLSLQQLDAGALSLPSILLSPMTQALGARFEQDSNFQLVKTFFNSLHFQSIDEQRIVILLDWQADNLQELEDQARQAFVSAREARRLLFYQEKLVETAAAFPESVSTVSLNDLLKPLFLFASINSAGGADPVAENRAVFIVLSAYITDFSLEQLIGSNREVPTPRNLVVAIERREDLARHVIGSAAIAASAGATMAEVLSVYKEVHDSRFRTGFSFTDIAANQAGTMLGMLASRSREDALLFQEQMMDSDSATDFLPSLGTYDGMTEAEFIDLYGSRESQAYQERLEEITGSIAARPFYQAFSR